MWGKKTGQGGEGGGKIRRAKITSVRARSAARLPRHEREMRIPPPIFTDLSFLLFSSPSPTTGPKIAALQSLSTPGGSCGGPTHAPTRIPPATPATAAPSLPAVTRASRSAPCVRFCACAYPRRALLPLLDTGFRKQVLLGGGGYLYHVSG